MEHQILYVENDKALEENYFKQWQFFKEKVIGKEQNKLSTRQVLDKMSVTIARAFAEGIHFKWSGLNANYPLPELDEAFDSDMRWLRYYLEATSDGQPKRISKKYERLRLLNLFLKLEFADFDNE